jgi:hypothetical protein
VAEVSGYIVDGQSDSGGGTVQGVGESLAGQHGTSGQLPGVIEVRARLGDEQDGAWCSMTVSTPRAVVPSAWLTVTKPGSQVHGRGTAGSLVHLGEFGGVFTPGNTTLLRARMAPQAEHRMVVVGLRFSAPEALGANVIDERPSKANCSHAPSAWPPRWAVTTARRLGT